jgi:acetyl-CoA/propionyl-CoA carboxylase biotin carboxyl carrier protein
MQVTGVYTTIPADVAILAHPDFQALRHSTKWVENELDLSGLTADRGEAPAQAEGGPDGAEGAKVRRDVDVEVNGKRFSVSMWVPEAMTAPVAVAGGTSGGKTAARPRRSAAAAAAAGAGSGNVIVPMQGTIVKLLVDVGAEVKIGDAICVLEAMKMENQIQAEKAGKVKEIKVQPGQTVGAGDVVAVIE